MKTNTPLGTYANPEAFPPSELLMQITKLVKRPFSFAVTESIGTLNPPASKEPPIPNLWLKKYTEAFLQKYISQFDRVGCRCHRKCWNSQNDYVLNVHFSTCRNVIGQDYSVDKIAKTHRSNRRVDISGGSYGRKLYHCSSLKRNNTHTHTERNSCQ